MDKELIKFEDQIYAQVSDNITLFEKSLADSQNMINDLKSIAEEKNRIIDGLENEKKNNNEKISQLESELEQKNAELDKSRSDMDRLENLKVDALKLAELVNETENRKAELDTKIAYYQELSDNLVSENKRLKSELEKETNNRKEYERKLNIEVVAHRDDTDKLNGIIKGLNDKINKLTGEIDELNGEIDKLEEKNEQLNGEKSSFEEEIADKDTEIKRLTLEHDISQKMIKSLKGDIQWLIGYAKDLDRKVMNSYQGNKQELDEHNRWLCNDSKGEDFKKFFGEIKVSDTECPKGNNESLSDCSESPEMEPHENDAEMEHKTLDITGGQMEYCKR